MKPVMRSSESNPPVIFEAAYYARLHDVERRHGWFRGLRDVGVTLMGATLASPPETFVDAGCGTGAVLAMAATRLRAKHTIGFDLAQEGLQQCRRDGYRQVAAATVERLPLADRSSDVVHSADVLQHLPKGIDAAFVAEAARVLRPGGILYIRTVAKERVAPAVRAGDPHYHQYSLDDLERLSEGAGLKVEYLTSVNILPALKNRLRSAKAGGVPAIPSSSPAEPLNTILRLLLAGEGRLMALTRWRCPYGRSIVCLARKPLV